MYSLLFLGSISFLLCALLTPIVRSIFLRWNLATRSESTEHQHPIPRAGGVAIVISYLAAYLCLRLVALNAGGITGTL